MRAFTQLQQLIQELGLLINKIKIVEPSDIMTCMDIEVDACWILVSLPSEKNDED